MPAGETGEGPWLRRLRAALAGRFGADARALAALRIGLGVLLLADLALRARSLTAFYTDAGVLPRSLLAAEYPLVSRLSVHALSGDVAWQALLFLLAGGCALAVVAGYRTRLAVLCSWLLLLSLHARNPMVLNGGDSLFRRLLFWGALCPLGARWSVDALRRPGTGARTRVATVATAGLLLQVVLVYLTNAVFKLDSDLWVEGGALAVVFRLDSFTTPLGALLPEVPAVLALFETGWPLLLAGSVGLVVTTGRRRGLLAGLFVGAHLSMALTMRLGLFPLVSVVGLVPFLPPGVWDRVERVAGRRARVARGSPLLSGVAGRLGALRPAPTDTVRSGERRARLRRWGRRAASALAAVVLAGLLVWNGAAVGLVDISDAPGTFDPAEDSWSMFAHPTRADVWVTAPATLATGDRVDALHGGTVREKPPPDGAAWYPSARWRKYLRTVRHDDGRLREGLAAGLCHRLRGGHGAATLTVSAVTERTTTRGDGPTTRRTLVTTACGA
jgi:hypothetical protein